MDSYLGHWGDENKNINFFGHQTRIFQQKATVQKPKLKSADPGCLKFSLTRNFRQFSQQNTNKDSFQLKRLCWELIFLFLAFSGKVLNIKHLSVIVNGGTFVSSWGNMLHIQSTTFCNFFPFFWPLQHETNQ